MAGRILAFDTATRATAVALCDPESGVLEARDDPPAGERPRHAAQLLPLSAGLLDRAGLGFGDVDRIAVGIGPGTFTGLRIGVATARALVQASQAEVVGVSTLESLALEAVSGQPDGPWTAIAAVLDARRREVFAAIWTLSELRRLEAPAGEPARPLIAPAAIAPKALAQTLAEQELSVLAVGDGAIEFRSVLERSGAFIPDDGAELHRVTAASHCRIARHLEPADPDQIRPQYLRLPDAEISRRATGR
jgi:tRNA threonylcarbamoyladenosine biosynthesis protein TsaB